MASPRSPRKPRVLIVEDEPLVRCIAEEEFDEAGFEVQSAADGQAALTKLGDTAPFDLLFTDIRMPGGIDGWAVAHAARAANPRIAVIYATGYAEGHDRIVADAAFFQKPYRFPAVFEAARRIGVVPRAGEA